MEDTENHYSVYHAYYDCATCMAEIEGETRAEKAAWKRLDKQGRA